jgi:hypothetical protein
MKKTLATLAATIVLAGGFAAPAVADGGPGEPTCTTGPCTNPSVTCVFTNDYSALVGTIATQRAKIDRQHARIVRLRAKIARLR